MIYIEPFTEPWFPVDGGWGHPERDHTHQDGNILLFNLDSDEEPKHSSKNPWMNKTNAVFNGITE